MAAINPKATRTRRGEHPDLTEDGYLRPQAFQYADPAARDFNVRFRNDPNWAAGFLEKVGERQRELPEWIQDTVGGQTFGEGQGHYAGLVEYQRELARLREIEDRYNYGEGVTVVRDHEIADMPMSRYDELFDSNNQPKPGVVLEHTTRSQRLDDGIDQASARELFNR